MATITVSDGAYARLTARAAAAGTTLEAVVDAIAEHHPTTAGPISTATQDRAFGDWAGRVERRAGRYPAGFVADASRESIYDDGRDE